jgi:putative transposase
VPGALRGWWRRRAAHTLGGMPRQPRLEIAGGTYHVTCRGNRQCPIFVDALDRERFLSLLADVVRRNEWRCFGYCLMTNHFHLVLETPDPNLGHGMHRLNGLYAQRFNQRCGHKGHLFEERFHSGLIVSDVHMLELARYVVLNPIRAGICNLPEEWPWSSYRAATGRSRVRSFLATDELLAYFGRTPEEARQEFAVFVRDGLRSRPR